MFPSIKASQLAAFRLERHHLNKLHKGKPTSGALAKVAGDVCGIQAQVLSAAELALSARVRGITRADVQAALSKDRTLVRTSCMRQTLHLLPSSEFGLFVMAVRRSRSAAIFNGMAKLGMSANDAQALNQFILEALADGPLTQHVVRKKVEPRAPKSCRPWMKRVWSICMLAVAEGDVCYGPPQGSDVTLVRTDQWLRRRKYVDETGAKQELLRRYLAGYGPATLRDFSHWSGIGMMEARLTWEVVRNQMAEVSVPDGTAFILERDLAQLRNAAFDKPVVRLLANFDSFLLAHAQKQHLVELPHYKRVYRQAGWISPVILLNGKVIGLWSYTKVRERLSVTVESLGAAVNRSIFKKIDEEAARIAAFLGMPYEVLSSK